MKHVIQRTFSNMNQEWSYQRFEDILRGLVYQMRDEIDHPLIVDRSNLRFLMNVPFYHAFSATCKMLGHNPDMYRNIRVIQDPLLYFNTSREGIVRLVYEEPEVKINPYRRYFNDDLILTHELYYSSVRKGNPHIDHVKFNGPATIVFWKDGTKTVVKHDGKGRKDRKQAILYAFIRKIYGEGRPYHDILNEIERAIK